MTKRPFEGDNQDPNKKPAQQSGDGAGASNSNQSQDLQATQNNSGDNQTPSRQNSPDPDNIFTFQPGSDIGSRSTPPRNITNAPIINRGIARPNSSQNQNPNPNPSPNVGDAENQVDKVQKGDAGRG